MSSEGEQSTFVTPSPPSWGSCGKKSLMLSWNLFRSVSLSFSTYTVLGQMILCWERVDGFTSCALWDF